MKKLIYIEALRLMQNQTLLKVIGFDESQRNEGGGLDFSAAQSSIHSYDRFDIEHNGTTIYLPGRRRSLDELPVVVDDRESLNAEEGIKYWENSGGFPDVKRPSSMTHFSSISSMDHQVVHLSNLSFEYLGNGNIFFLLRLIRLKSNCVGWDGRVFEGSHEDFLSNSRLEVSLISGDLSSYDHSIARVGGLSRQLYLANAISDRYQSIPFSWVSLYEDCIVDPFKWVMWFMQGVNQKLNLPDTASIIELCNPIDPTSGKIF